ncbi:ATP-binding protein [Streptomyces sp. H10-C2]|uniref:ATP-binding protein n=1 Tax=unclassified Streptomyces TaxID=2593676 RepID=UPI0024BB9DDF|nr:MULTISPECIES: ATP-binding protein [unclassified Streptomyces]MDJ0345558.1 ATP-binding protein [Streptomyces sp. PH10-H1]MDJ0374504.1 ATP-binding protein [Streptomyces sp. H10-C2]
MKFAQKVGTFLGIGGDRSASPPQYVALADGLIITDTHAEGWYVLADANTDLMSESARDGELDQANAALARTLAGMDCHLRVLWSPLHAADYLDEAAEMFTAGNWPEWAATRVDRMEQIGLPSRHLVLGVRLTERTGEAQKLSRRGIQQGLGVASAAVSSRELARLDAVMRRLGRRLETSPWRAQPASVDMLAWMISREQQRAAPLPAANNGVISGAKLASLTRGRILPHPDHLRVVNGRGEVAAWVSVLAMTGFPEEMESPGAGEWLRILSEINYVPEIEEDILDDDGLDPASMILPVSPEASVRFRVLPKRDAIKKVDEARRLAKEQRKSAAKQSAEDPGREILDTEEVMTGLKRDMQREDVTLVDDHPRLIITSTVSLVDLRARVDAVIGHYGGLGIEVSVGEEEQRELWLESQPGDQLRVPDFGHTRDVAALSGSWFWGGARVGDDSGPIVGYLTGSTPGTFRNDITAGSERGDATTSAFIGRSGRGKTTSMMLSILDAGFRGAYCLALDFKGDLGGVVTAARRYGLNAHLVETGPRFAGVCDLFQLLDKEGSERAQIEVPAQLGIAVPPHLRARGAETPIQHATNEVIKAGEPATWKVIQYLRGMDDPLARETGEALYELGETGIGAPFMGRPTGEAPLTPEPGIWVVQIPGLSLPGAETDREDWNVLQRLSVALMHSMLAYGITTAGRRDLRGLRKVVAVPEVHVLTATKEGSAFLSYIARVGRALSTSLVIDTQDCESLIKLVGVIEQLTMVAGFQLTTKDQQDALAELLGLPKTAHTRALIQSVGILSDGDIRHGHCIIRDRRFSCATVQWDVPSDELLKLLDTTPRADVVGAVKEAAV